MTPNLNKDLKNLSKKINKIKKNKSDTKINFTFHIVTRYQSNKFIFSPFRVLEEELEYFIKVFTKECNKIWEKNSRKMKEIKEE